MGKIQFTHGYHYIISLENLLEAWQEFLCGKRQRQDVLKFQNNLMTNVLKLHQELVNFSYQHSGYQAFKISDPKPRQIHKASVRDRLLHHAIYRQLYPFFDRTFIADSYSCRNNKGTHKAIDRFRIMARRVSKNNTKTCWVLKCDIKKFFANIDHGILKSILAKYIPDQEIVWLLNGVIDSFEVSSSRGLPLGNLTSQLFVNVYMNEFDQYVKHKLRQKYYIRYADDFIFLSDDKQELLNIVRPVHEFLREKLKLQIHPQKISLSTLASGIDYLGYVSFPHYRVLRTKTKNRALRLVNSKNLSSYLGVCKHANTYEFSHILRNKVDNMTPLDTF